MKHYSAWLCNFLSYVSYQTWEFVKSNLHKYSSLLDEELNRWQVAKDLVHHNEKESSNPEKKSCLLDEQHEIKCNYCKIK